MRTRTTTAEEARSGVEAPDLEGDTPVSFNDGINSDLFPTLQITSKHLLRRLTLVGKGARAAKVDGRYPHWVSPWVGERYSVIVYKTRGEPTPIGPAVFHT